MEPIQEGKCFACGPANPIGLKLEFRFEGDEYVTEFTPREVHQGFDGITHGGLVATVLDEVMANMLWKLGIQALTTELQVTLRQPARVGERLIVRGAIEEQRSRKVICRAAARREDGALVAEARGTFIRVREI